MKLKVKLSILPIGQHQLLLIFWDDNLFCSFQYPDYIVCVLYCLQCFSITFFAIQNNPLLFNQDIQYFTIHLGLMSNSLFLQLLFAHLPERQAGFLLLLLHVIVGIVFFKNCQYFDLPILQVFVSYFLSYSLNQQQIHAFANTFDSPISKLVIQKSLNLFDQIKGKAIIIVLFEITIKIKSNDSKSK